MSFSQQHYHKNLSSQTLSPGTAEEGDYLGRPSQQLLPIISAHAQSNADSVEMDQQKRRGSSYKCGHCGEAVSKTVYFQHKRLYYCDDTNSWSQGNLDSDEFEEFTFSDMDEEESVGFQSQCNDIAGVLIFS